jgi:arylsulfatase A-like enzyme
MNTLAMPAGAVRLARQYTEAMMHLVDRSVGRIFAALKNAGLWENSIVIFTSDHGDYLGDFGLIMKETVCSNALCHVPFLMRVPSHLGARLPAETDLPMSNADVLPTLCELTGAPAPEFVQGRSILGALRGGTATPVPSWGYFADPRFHNFSLCDERFRFTWFPATGERQLFDHREDPFELRNRAGDAALKGEEARLYQHMLELHARTDNPAAGRITMW